MHLHRLHRRLHFLQLFVQLLMGALHRVGHMIHRRLHARRCLCLSLLLLQGFLYIIFISRYRPDLSGAVSLTARHRITLYCVLMVAIRWEPEIFARMGTHSVCPTVMCKITVVSTAAASAQIPVVL